MQNERTTVGLGAKVFVDINGRPNEFTIVGTLEADPSLGKISDESPVGKILLGKKWAIKLNYLPLKHYLQNLKNILITNPNFYFVKLLTTNTNTKSTSKRFP